MCFFSQCLIAMDIFVFAGNNGISGKFSSFFLSLFSLRHPFCWYEKWNIKRCISKSISIVVPVILSSPLWIYGRFLFFSLGFYSIFTSFVCAFRATTSLVLDDLFVLVKQPKSSANNIFVIKIWTQRREWRAHGSMVNHDKNKNANIKCCWLSKLVQIWHIFIASDIVLVSKRFCRFWQIVCHELWACCSSWRIESNLRKYSLDSGNKQMEITWKIFRTSMSYYLQFIFTRQPKIVCVYEKACARCPNCTLCDSCSIFCINFDCSKCKSGCSWNAT